MVYACGMVVVVVMVCHLCVCGQADADSLVDTQCEVILMITFKLCNS